MRSDLSIFIIEKNLDIANAIKDRLKAYSAVNITVNIFQEVRETIENNLLQPDIVFINHYVFSRVTAQQKTTISDLIKGIRIVTISGKKETRNFTKALRNGVDYYIPSEANYLQKVDNYINCFLNDSIPDKTTLLKQWYMELAQEET